MRAAVPPTPAVARQRLRLPLRAADKTGKSDFIEIINGEFIQARIKLDPARCAPLADEYAGLIWDERSLKREEHPNCPNDLAHATLYAWRLCYSYLSEAIPAPPKMGTPEWHKQIEDELEEAEVQRCKEQLAMREEAEQWGPPLHRW